MPSALVPGNGQIHYQLGLTYQALGRTGQVTQTAEHLNRFDRALAALMIIEKEKSVQRERVSGSALRTTQAGLHEPEFAWTPGESLHCPRHGDRARTSGSRLHEGSGDQHPANGPIDQAHYRTEQQHLQPRPIGHAHEQSRGDQSHHAEHDAAR